MGSPLLNKLPAKKPLPVKAKAKPFKSAAAIAYAVKRKAQGKK